ncbi:hypothetical protein BCR43DRAFT_105367 [Syncephalastrum racemosum]|uniref:NDT80 domain-containing protein n=1 Tax=Syncephalastrum racemosum TaxID=13706 RepID=A0A1X2H1Q4_SYNRA|nr:hypothetical protein BCR43DRAFT_105367 [Syncephalastrum racemosum]
MMALSQPGTPRPGEHSPPHPQAVQHHLEEHRRSSTSFGYASPPIPFPGMQGRKRGRNDSASLFQVEAGPVFSSTKSCDNLYGLDRTTLLAVRIQSKFDRGFFLADNDWTCYRRNYFQISSAFIIPGMSPYCVEPDWPCLVQQEDGNLYPVQRFLLGISARVSNSDKKIDLVQHTPKRDKGPQMTPVPRSITPGGNLSMSTVGTNQNIVTFERIQFKTATANNGKRRAAQQYYVCLVDLYAETDTGATVRIASCQSAPLVVRGRSPGHYSDTHDRYDVLMTGNGVPQTAPPPPPPPPPSGLQDEHSRFGSYGRPPMVGNGDYSPYGYYPSPAAAAAAAAGYPYQHQTPPAPLPTMLMHHPHQSQHSQHGATTSPTTPTGNHHSTGNAGGANGTHGPGPHTPSSLPPPPSSASSYSSHYMVPSMSDPSSSESSSPDLYNGEYHHHHHHQQQHHHHPQHHPSDDKHPVQGIHVHPMDPSSAAAAAAAAAAAGVDWSTRSRYHSAGAPSTPLDHPHQSSPSYFQQAPTGPPGAGGVVPPPPPAGSAAPVLPSPTAPYHPQQSPFARNKYPAVMHPQQQQQPSG